MCEDDGREDIHAMEAAADESVAILCEQRYVRSPCGRPGSDESRTSYKYRFRPNIEGKTKCSHML